MAAVSNETVLHVFDAILRRQDDVLSSPASCQKRASVALIVAFFPDKLQTSSSGIHASKFDELDNLKAHVRHSSDVPHVLFIRRAARSTDRWSSHVALPGGRREPDESDLDAAVRETMEEVSLDITSGAAFCAGSLGQRLVTSRLGTMQLLTLCPYLFLLKEVGRAPLLTGQASEVHACHWVPISELLDSANATQEYVNVSGRLVGGEKSVHQRAYKILQSVVQWNTGSLSFSGIALKPSISVFSTLETAVTEAAGTSDSDKEKKSITTVTQSPPSRQQEKLILWGLTHAVMLDYLDFFPGSQVRQNWQFPTFSRPDLALMLYLLNTRHRQRYTNQPHNSDVLHSFDTSKSIFDWVGNAMNGYYKTLRRGILLTMIARALFVFWLCQRLIYKRRLP